MLTNLFNNCLFSRPEEYSRWRPLKVKRRSVTLTAESFCTLVRMSLCRWNMAQLGPYRKELTHICCEDQEEKDIVTLHLLHTLCLWAAGLAVKEKNILIHREAAEKMKCKCKQGHWTCDTKYIYPEMFCQIFTLHCVLFTAMKVWRLVFPLTATFSPEPPLKKTIMLALDFNNICS